ncbi:MAG: hypothetical protein KGZ73_07085 [Rhizobiales bacterium]|jgi:ABC-type Fe3+ transport system permease subunit|nr:hypothetical protein [Hyphomicrobiales bacterium]
MSLLTADRDRTAVAERHRVRALGTAFAELVLTFSLIVSIAAIVAVAGSGSALAAPRTDLILIEESVSSSFTTAGIVAVIAVVMGILTILALRDVAPAHSKRDNRRTSRR